MRKRAIKKLYKRDGWERLKRYGLSRSRGHRSTRRGRRHILRNAPELRDRSSLTPIKRIDLLWDALNQLQRDDGVPESKRPMRIAELEHCVNIKWPDLEGLTAEERLAVREMAKELAERFESKMHVQMLDAMGIPEGPARYPSGAR